MLSLVHMFLSLLRVFPSASLQEGRRKGWWVGTSDVMLTNISNGKLDSFCPHELPYFLLSFFLSCDGLWWHACKFSFEFQLSVDVGCKVNTIALYESCGHLHRAGRDTSPVWKDLFSSSQTWLTKSYSF